MNLQKIYEKCFAKVGGKSNKDVSWYLNDRPKKILRQPFFEEAVYAIWVSGKSRNVAVKFLKKAKAKGFRQKYSVIGSWNKGELRQFVEKLHGKPVPKGAYKRWESIYNIAKQINRYSSEDEFRASYFGGKVSSSDLNKEDVQNLVKREYYFIGDTNAKFILRNIGGEFIKPDRWIEELLGYCKMSEDELESKVKDLDIPLGLFDVVIWLYCEKYVKETKYFKAHFKKLFA